MILHQPRSRPAPWRQHLAKFHSWLTPLAAAEWCFEWLAFGLSRWSFLEVLEYLSSFSVLVAVIFYFSESGDRLKQKHYQAWQVINTAQGRGGSGGRVDALQELNEDGIPLVGVNVAGAFLQGIRLPKARLLRSDFSGADVRNGDLAAADLDYSNLEGANFRDADLHSADLQNSKLGDTDLCRANLSRVDLSGASLDGADLGNADLNAVNWRQIKSVQRVNIHGVRNAPSGFVEWAIRHGAVNGSPTSDCQ